MKIIIPTIGSRGDVQPYINLAQGLRYAGHDVTLATNLPLCPLVEQHSVKATALSAAIRAESDGVTQTVRMIEEVI